MRFPVPEHTATVRVPADADDGDTIDGSVTTIDATRIAVTTTFQLLVGENTAPTAGGVPANMGSIDSPLTMSPVIQVHKVTDGFQNRRDGSTVTLRGVGNDADGDSIITAWALREGPDHSVSPQYRYQHLDYGHRQAIDPQLLTLRLRRPRGPLPVAQA